MSERRPKPFRIDVSIPVLTWAVARAEDPNLVEARTPNLSKWIAGTERPTLRQLERLAKATATPLGYFFMPEPPEDTLPLPHFRTFEEGVPASPSSALMDTVHLMYRRQGWMRDYLRDQGHEPLQFVGSASLGDDHHSVAESIRNTLGLSSRWASGTKSWTAAGVELRRRMEAIGIVVVINGIVGNNTHRRLDPREFRGFVLVDRYAPFVFVNGADAKAAQMFTLAHELAHLWFGSSAVFDLGGLRPAEDITEKACDRVAAEILVPEDELLALWPSIRDLGDFFNRVARWFRVSELVAARRLSDLQLITREHFAGFYEHYYARWKNEKAKKDDDDEVRDFYVNQNLRVSRLFAGHVLSALRQDHLLYKEAYRMTGLYGSTFEKYMDRLSQGGKA